MDWARSDRHGAIAWLSPGTPCRGAPDAVLGAAPDSQIEAFDAFLDDPPLGFTTFTRRRSKSTRRRPPLPITGRLENPPADYPFPATWWPT